MANTYTAITKHDENWWIGWIEEVPGVNCQERSREELIDNLKEALEFNRQEAIQAFIGSKAQRGTRSACAEDM